MKISIITVTYNSGDTLRDTIESVLSQTHADFEHIIKDGGSTDNTLEIVKEYRDRYQGRLVVVSCRDQGIFDAMNQGVLQASGDVVGFLNSDDFYHDNAVLATIANGFTDNDVKAIYGNLLFVNHHDKSSVIRTWIGSQYYPGAFMRGWHPAHPTFYVRRECFDRFGLFDTDFEISADFELMLRFIERGRIKTAYLPHTLVMMRMGGESTKSIANIIKGNRNVLRAFKKNGFKVPPFYIFRRLMPKAMNMLKTVFKS